MSIYTPKDLSPHPFWGPRAPLGFKSTAWARLLSVTSTTKVLNIWMLQTSGKYKCLVIQHFKQYVRNLATCLQRFKHFLLRCYIKQMIGSVDKNILKTPSVGGLPKTDPKTKHLHLRDWCFLKMSGDITFQWIQGNQPNLTYNLSESFWMLRLRRLHA